MRRFAKYPALMFMIQAILSSPVWAVSGGAGNDSFGSGEAPITAFGAVGSILRIVLSSIGAIFILIGVVRYAIAHSQEDSPSQQKAAMMIGAGIALVVLGNVAVSLAGSFATLIPTDFGG